MLFLVVGDAVDRVIRGTVVKFKVNGSAGRIMLAAVIMFDFGYHFSVSFSYFEAVTVILVLFSLVFFGLI